jgi:hypothetical protein
MKKIAFIVSGHKTPLFFKVSKILEEKNNIESLWISPNKEWADYLIGQGTDKKKILDISRYWDKKTGSPKGREILSSIEKTLPYSISTIIKIDRNLREKKSEYSNNYLEVLAEQVHAFLENQNIIKIFSEQTWAFDIIPAYIAESMGAESLTPLTVRFPSDHFAFFKGSKHEEIIRTRNKNIERTHTKELLYEFKNKDIKPFYFHGNNKLPKIKADYFGKIIKHLNWSNDETKNTTAKLVSMRIKEYINSRSIKNEITQWTVTPSNNKFILLTLHKQPEASVDLFDYYNSNQLDLAINIANALPINYTLMIKEHSNAIGDRGLNWFKELKKLKNVKLVNPYIPVREFIEKSEAVISVSGTSCLEAALLGKKAICTANVYFKQLLSLSDCSIKEIAKHARTEFVELNAPTEEEILKYLDDTLSRSFKGIISDIKSIPSIVEEPNISNVAAGFEFAITHDA